MVSYSDVAGEALHELRADLVIAADSAQSALRERICPVSAPRYVRFITWRSAVPAAAVSEASRKVLEGRLLIFRAEGPYTVS